MEVGPEKDTYDNRLIMQADHVPFFGDSNCPRTNAGRHQLCPQLRRRHWAIPLERT